MKRLEKQDPIYPLVTIAIPVFNCERYIERCLNSIIKQDYNNIEILIVYDPGEDNSYELIEKIIKEYELNCRIIIKKPSDRGPGKSRNIILENFEGDYLFFVDSDDYIESFAISLLVKEALINNADVVAASHKTFSDKLGYDRIFNYHSKRIFNNSEFKEYLYVKNGYYSVYSWNKLYKASFIRKNCLKYVHNFVEDAMFTFFEVKYLNTIVLLPEITLHYMINTTSITNSMMFKNISYDMANIYISIRDMQYSINNKDKFEDLCSNFDIFFFTYIMIVRDTYKSSLISKGQKYELFLKAIKTPIVPIHYYLRLLFCKKEKYFIFLLIKSLPNFINFLLVKIYHKLKIINN